MKQLKVSLDDAMRGRLESAATGHDRSLGEEIRDRLERSFAWEGQFDPWSIVLMHSVGRLAALTKRQTGRDWFVDAGAHFVFRQAIRSLLARMKPKGDPVLDPATLPADRPVALDDPTAMGVALEAIVSFDRPLTGDEQRGLHEKYENYSDSPLAGIFAKLGLSQPVPRSQRRKPKDEGGHG
jgi:hypothetical protein